MTESRITTNVGILGVLVGENHFTRSATNNPSPSRPQSTFSRNHYQYQMERRSRFATLQMSINDPKLRKRIFISACGYHEHHSCQGIGNQINGMRKLEGE